MISFAAVDAAAHASGADTVQHPASGILPTTFTNGLIQISADTIEHAAVA